MISPSIRWSRKTFCTFSMQPPSVSASSRHGITTESSGVPPGTSEGSGVESGTVRDSRSGDGSFMADLSRNRVERREVREVERVNTLLAHRISGYIELLFFLVGRLPLRSRLFPYPTLFR